MSGDRVTWHAHVTFRHVFTSFSYVRVDEPGEMALENRVKLPLNIVVGMSRAFLAAGARAVVASLWAIDDIVTKVFMLKFYSHLKRGKSTSKSLQQTMREMRETEKYKEPRNWAAFFLIGDDVTISV